MVTVTGIAPGASGVADGEAHTDAADRTRNGSPRVAAVFSDHMVLQRETPIAVFGTAPADERVVASLTDAQGVTVAQTMAVAQTVAAVQTPNGADTPAPEASWLATLPSLPAGGPYTMRVSHETDRVDFTDVMIGEVWLAGGPKQHGARTAHERTRRRGDCLGHRPTAAFLQHAQGGPRRRSRGVRFRVESRGGAASSRHVGGRLPFRYPSARATRRGCGSASSTATSAARRSPVG